jgi:hypothetical protein
MRYVTGDKLLNPGIPVAGEIAAPLRRRVLQTVITVGLRTD